MGIMLLVMFGVVVVVVGVCLCFVVLVKLYLVSLVGVCWFVMGLLLDMVGCDVVLFLWWVVG